MEFNNKADLNIAKSQISKWHYFSVIIIVCVCAYYVSISKDHPYYYMSDMDQTTTVDSLLIQSDHLPDHVAHPGYGMYLVLSVTQKIARYFNVVSAINFNDLSFSLNPIASVAELADFIRLHSPFLSLGIVLCLWKALSMLFNLPHNISFLALMIFASQGSLIFNSSWIRTELWSAFFWSCAVLLVIYAARAKHLRHRLLWLMVSGLLLGLTYFTKIQSLFYVVSVPLIFVYGLLVMNKIDCYIPTGKVWAVISIGIFNLVAYVAVGHQAYNLSELYPGNNLHAQAVLMITPHAVSFFGLLFGLLVCEIFIVTKKEKFSTLFKLCTYLTIILFGFIISLSFHFLILSDLSLSWSYLLYNFKAAFFYGGGQIQLFHPVRDFSLLFKFTPIPILIYLISIILVSIDLFRSKFSRSIPLFVMMIMLFVIVGLNAMVAVRVSYKDVLWLELLMNFLTIVNLTSILVFRRNKVMSKICWTMLSLLLLANLSQNRGILKRIDADLTFDGWKYDSWFKGTYDGNHHIYTDFMLQRYRKEDRKSSSQHALNRNREIRIANFVLRNQNITQRNLGFVEKNNPVWTEHVNYRIVEFPKYLNNAIVVDSSSADISQNGFLDKQLFKTGYVLDRDIEPRSMPALAILPRPDIIVYIFLEEKDIHSFDKNKYEGIRIKLSNGSKSKVLYGLKIPKYTVAPLKKLKGSYFFVILPLII